jgi:hypothetical protein
MAGRMTFRIHTGLNDVNIDTKAGSIRTSPETQSVCITKINRLMLFRETVAVYCENHTEHIDTLCGQNSKSLCGKPDGTYNNK